MPSALRSTSTASFYEAKLPSEALLGPSEDCNLRIPYVFLTNGGRISESKRALELSSLLGVKISPLQVLQGHAPFKQLLNRFENELIVRFLSKTKYFTLKQLKLSVLIGCIYHPVYLFLLLLNRDEFHSSWHWLQTHLLRLEEKGRGESVFLP
ncbi:uncharacterized protein LOC125468600 isoform X1 [Pyrus x bretschneideri]|uniref:uncharacterized protein LOC125468600 isoform X1 n=2 Tax=Pyrus x bretschneideri TaxID=225117 RepID=UPI0020308DB5|nr:uncharacterized protein LOC125468600 isoform X1 [Pyrus x bretschneideri]